MITPEDLPHFITEQHDRLGSLAFLRSNNSILTCLFYLWLSLVEKMFGLLALIWLFYQVAGMLFFGIDFCIIYYERRNLNHKATRDVANLFFWGGGYIRKAFLPDFRKLPEIFKTYSARIFIIFNTRVQPCQNV